MSATYRLKGRRWLRKYTAPNLTPSTAAGSDVAAITDRLCDVPWSEASLDAYPSFPTYATNKVDENAGARDCFDAAEWCAGHDESKRHRAYAQAAIYRFALPASARSVTLESVTVSVTCDPYTPQGARVAAMLTDDDELPTACGEVRAMDDFKSGVAPRTVVTNESTGAVTWYETTASAELTLNGSGKKWLLVFVGLEDYRARNGWLEGAAKINAVQASFSDLVDGFDIEAPVDLRFDGEPTVVLAGGSSPTWLQPLNMLYSNGVKASVRTLSKTYYLPLYSGSYGFYISISVSYDPSDKSFSLSGKSYYKAYGTDGTAEDMGTNSVALTVTQKALARPAKLNGLTIPDTTKVYVVTAKSAASGTTSQSTFLAYPTLVDGHVVLHIFGYNGDELIENVHSPIDMGAIPKAVLDGGVDACVRLRAGDSSDEAIGDMSWQIATADSGSGARTASDTFGHLLGLTRVVGDGIAANYAFANVFPLSDLDRVTIVPRFARASTLPSGQKGDSQPGLSLWFHKSTAVDFGAAPIGSYSAWSSTPCCTTAPSFVQSCFLAVQSTTAGKTVRLTAIADVPNTGVEFRLAAWRSSGVSWEGTSGYNTAQQLVKAVGFADASEASVEAPAHKFQDGTFKGLPQIGGVTAERVGMSDVITGALAANDVVEIQLTTPLSAGDVLVIAPVPVALSAGFSGADAYFGRQANPAAETTKSWCRYTANLGWFPKIEIM